MADNTRHRNDKTTAVPDPARPEFFEFLEKLWDSDEPEKVILCQALGEKGARMGTILKTHAHKPNMPKPAKEFLVGLSNEFLMLAQNNCDALGQPQKYSVVGINTRKSDKPYATWLLDMVPKVVSGDADDDDDLIGGKANKKAEGAVLAKFKVMAKDHRWREEQFATVIGDIIKTQKDMLTEANARNNLLMAQYLEAFKAQQDALDRTSERKTNEMWAELQIKGVLEGIGLFKGVLPMIVKRITGGETPPGSKSAEAMVIENFIDSCTPEQSLEAFGFDKASQKFVKEGVFTIDQIRLFEAIVKGDPGASVDALFEGPLAVTDPQMMAAQGIFTMMQLVPLIELAKDVAKKREAKQAALNPQQEQAVQNSGSGGQSDQIPPATPKSDNQ